MDRFLLFGFPMRRGEDDILSSGNASSCSMSALDQIIGESRAILELREAIVSAARSDRPVLVHGPTGAGKELVVRAIHELGSGRDQPFVDVNCGSIPQNLIEAQLFGFERGAFTGAETNRVGYFAAARGGTLFLDEIGEMPFGLQ